VGSACALEPGTDLVVPYARNIGTVLVLGMTAREIMLNLFAASIRFSLLSAWPASERSSPKSRRASNRRGVLRFYDNLEER